MRVSAVCYGTKQAPRWLWHALDHRTGKVLAYVFGRREDRAFLELKALLVPFGIRRFYTDGWGAYKRHLAPELHEVGKHHTQQLERKHRGVGVFSAGSYGNGGDP
jgi:insertion element IS1 protein InsB